MVFEFGSISTPWSWLQAEFAVDFTAELHSVRKEKEQIFICSFIQILLLSLGSSFLYTDKASLAPLD